ncbi:DUF3566 domain-containing protein [Dermabacter sp. Marseille-Q3180]|uniref:DUF3566 domain-containing protein n=1 Tax=Dermabacter sp. Marseille-Q3180 TaxID=2758090 RepID=UPI002023FF0F|nr:DUF3566 domain-containing protein [Dermabacter sp. Marseille-Q3180]
MSSTSDDKTQPIAKQGGPEQSAESRNATDALSEGVTSRIDAIKSGEGDEPKSSSRTKKNAQAQGAKKGNAASGQASDRKGDQTPSPSASKASQAGTSRTQRQGAQPLPKSRTTHQPAGRPVPGAHDAAPAQEVPRQGGRRVKLTLSQLDPWSVMKLSFLVAIAFGIALIIAVALLWQIVDAIGLWDQIHQIGSDLNSGKPLPFMEYFEFSKMLSYSVIVSVLNVVIITALGTLFAFLYNIVASLLGGLKVTLTDN